jgi:CHAT domain-containing protein
MDFTPRTARSRIGRAFYFFSICLSLLFLRSPSSVSGSLLGRLVSGAPRSYRLVEARLAGGFAWAPLRRTVPPEAANEESGLMAVAGAILNANGASQSAAVLPAAAARLLLGDADDAVGRFEQIVRLTPGDGGAWCDLAAARYTAAMQQDAPHWLPDALAAVDRALRLQPDDSVTRFNRALILERMGLNRPARSAWSDVLLVESDAGWLAEARSHVATLAAAVPRPFADDFQLSLSQALSGDRTLLQLLVRTRTQEMRTNAETLLLGAWGDAAAKGENPESDRILAEARMIGDALARSNGDCLLQDAVHAIDTAAKTRWRALGATEKAYRDARWHYSNQRQGSAEELRRAAVSFASAGSPMADVALFYAANATSDDSRAEDARAMLEDLEARVDSRRYPSLAAGVETQLGRYYAFRGTWSASLLHLDRASKLYHRLGEGVNGAFTEATIAEVHDRIGQFLEGWRRRIASFAVLSRSAPDDRLVHALIGGAHAEIMEADSEAALSLLDLAVGEAGRRGYAGILAEGNLRRAQVLTSMGRSEAGSRALTAARQAAARIEDVYARARINADIATVDGEILRHRTPCAAAGVLSEPIRFYETNSFDMFLPVPYLARARARLACGDSALALDDLRKGLASVERQRATVAPDVRVTVFDTIPDLVAETVALLLSQGRDEEAYGTVESARARTLVEALGINHSDTHAVRSADVAACLPEDTAVVEYALLPDGVATFCLTRRGMTVSRVKADPARLRDLTKAFATATAERQPLPDVEARGAELYDLLIAPAVRQAGEASRLIIIPDRFLNLVPFTALFDRASRRYLIEKFGVVIAPSGAFLCERQTRSRGAGTLILSDPLHGSEAERLPAAQNEAREVAGLYSHPVVLVGSDATVARFRREAPSAGLIHYSGHAGSNDTGGFLPLAPAGRDEGKYDATEISRLPLRQTWLVVLAGCGTLVGSAQRVEGMPSLSRSFLAAGVPSVIGMLWDVDDRATRGVLVAFHRAIVRGASPADALRETQRRLITSNDVYLSHPATWAASELLGVN